MKIIYDNNKNSSTCRDPWGFSTYLDEYKLLFDTGGNGRILLENMKKVCVDINEIKYLFISHEHWDHIGGIDSILELNKDLIVFVPSSFSDHFIDDLKMMCKRVVICDEKPKRLFDNIYTTGILGKDIPEQALVIDDNFPKVITGCGHYGIENIVKISKKIINKDIKYAIGGFHLLHKQRDEIYKTIKTLKKLGIEKVLPTHCTGNLAIEMCKKSFIDNYITGGVGKNLMINNKK